MSAEHQTRRGNFSGGAGRLLDWASRASRHRHLVKLQKRVHCSSSDRRAAFRLVSACACSTTQPLPARFCSALLFAYPASSFDRRFFRRILS